MPNYFDNPKSKLDLFSQKMYIIIYGVNTPAGKAFDVALLIAILLSVFTIMAETVEGIDHTFHRELIVLEWIFTIIFTLEYALRIFVSKKPLQYIFSFYGIIDLLSILPMFLSVFIKGSHILSSSRILRLLRLFRVFRLIEFVEESAKLKVALMASRAKKQISKEGFSEITHWIRLAVILKFIREFTKTKFSYKRSFLNPAQLFIISFLG